MFTLAVVFLRVIVVCGAIVHNNTVTRSPAVAEGPRDAGVPVEILSAAQM